MPRRPASLRPAAPLIAAVLVVSGTLAACGGPRKSDAKTIDAIVIDRGVLIGAKGDAPPGVRALNTGVPKNLGQLEDEVRQTLFGDGGKKTFTGYLNGIEPKGGRAERAYPGDRAGWLQRDVSDPAAVPGAVVGLFPAPFTSRFTPKRRLMPTRVQCAEAESNGCRATLDSLSKAGVRTGISGLQDATATTALRVYVGTWPELRPVLAKNRLKTALEIEQEPERNGFGLQISPDGRSIVEGATFGEMADTGTFGGGTGVVFATRDILGNTFWVVTGTDDEGVNRAAEAISEDELDGRVAAIAPPR